MSAVQSTSSSESFLDFQAPATVRQASVTYTDGAPNIVAQIIKSGAPKPHATVSNTMVARVDSYTPPPGINLAHYLALDVDKADDYNPTTVVDAIQRYFNVRPRREPIADPQDIASTDSYPTLVIDEASNYANLKPYHYSINGIERKADLSSFYADSGHMQVRIKGTGVTSIKSPATDAKPGLEVGPIKTGMAYYPPEYAAQMASSRLTNMMDTSDKMPTYEVGPDLNRGVNDTLPEVAATLAPLRAALFNGGSRYPQSGSLGTYGSSLPLNQSAVNLSMV
ncbi:MAG: hypothetical protein LBE27_04530 [Deltaproteobacteria bacterium]|nr:hypothetical protein [Deltaproteobacteria bacterium]